MSRKKILFICTHNSARSQIAEGLVNVLHGGIFEARSAGTEPSRINPLAVEVLGEIGINISEYRSKGLEQFIAEEFDYVITVCDHAKETCPIFPGAKNTIHKGFEDPASVSGPLHKQKKAFRTVRDQIKEWIENELISICFS